MSTNSQEQEIDLGQLFNKASSFFKNIINSTFNLIFFIQKKIIIIIGLLVIGIVLAYLVDGEKEYEHELSVIPNFGSNEYLYKIVDELDTKLREDDPEFFKKIGIKDYDNILSVKIEAFPAVYNFINNKDQENNFELIKLLGEDGDLVKILSDDMTSKNYYHHKITIVTKGMWKRVDLIDPILNYLNKNQYFIEQQKVNQQNLEEKLVANDSLTKQIDKIIYLLSSNNKGGSSFSISENSSIPELVNKKDNLISESHRLKTSKLIYDKIIKEESTVLNIRKYVPLMLNSKILFPFVLILLFLISFPIMNTYKKQKLRIEGNN